MTAPFHSTREIIIRTPDFDAAVSHYEHTLNLPKSYDSPTIVGFETGSFCLYIERGEKHAVVFEFLVPDVSAARAQLLNAGCTLVEEDASVPRCYLRDPYGLTFNIRQRG